MDIISFKKVNEAGGSTLPDSQENTFIVQNGNDTVTGIMTISGNLKTVVFTIPELDGAGQAFVELKDQSGNRTFWSGWLDEFQTVSMRTCELLVNPTTVVITTDVAQTADRDFVVSLKVEDC